MTQRQSMLEVDQLVDRQREIASLDNALKPYIKNANEYAQRMKRISSKQNLIRKQYDDD